MQLEQLLPYLQYLLIQFLPNKNRHKHRVYSFSQKKPTYLPDCWDIWNLRITSKSWYRLLEKVWLQNCFVSVNQLKSVKHLEDAQCIVFPSVNVTLELPTTLTVLQFHGHFNQPIDLTHFIHLKKLVFGWNFNQSLHLPSQLQSLKLGTCFDQPLRIPNTLTNLYIGCNFSQPIPHLPASLTSFTSEIGRSKLPSHLPRHLTYLSVGTSYGYKLYFPKTLPLTHLIFPCEYQYLVKTLPSSLIHLQDFDTKKVNGFLFPPNLETLEFSDRFNQPLTKNWFHGSNLLSLKLGYDFNRRMDVPSSVTKLILSSSFNQPISFRGGSLVFLEFGYDFNQPIDIKYMTNLHTLLFNHDFNQPIDTTYNEQLQKLVFGRKFNQLIDFTYNQQLQTLIFGADFNQTLEIPVTVTKLIFEGNFNYPLTLTPALVHLEFGSEFDQPLDFTLVTNLQTLVFCEKFNQPINIPSSVTELQLGDRFNQYLHTDGLSKLTSLTFGYDFNQPFYTNGLSSLTVLTFGYSFNQPIDFPNLCLRKLIFGDRFLQKISVPPSLKKMELTKICCEMNSLPAHVTYTLI